MANGRVSGLMFAIYSDGTSVGKTGEQLASDAMHYLLRRELLAMLPKGHTLSFSVPLVIEDEELETAFVILDER